MATSQGPVLVQKERLSALEEALSLARNQQRDRRDDRPLSARELNPPVSADPGQLEIPVPELRKLAAQYDYVEGLRRPMGRRALRTAIGFFISASIGVAATLAWQSYGEEAHMNIRRWADTPLSSWSWKWTKSSPRDEVTAEQTPLTVSVQTPPDEADPPPSAPVPQLHPLQEAAAPSFELVEQLKTVAQDLATLQQSVAELAAKQEQTSANIATLQAAELETRLKIAAGRKKPVASAQPPSATPAAAPRKPAQTTTQSPSSHSLSTQTSNGPARVPPPPSLVRE